MTATTPPTPPTIGLPEPDCVECPPELIQQWPEPVNLCIYEGDDFFLDLALTYECAHPAGCPYELVGYTAQAQIRPTPLDIVVLANFDTSISEAEGIVHLHLSAEQNRAMAVIVGGADPTGQLVSGMSWDAQITSPAGYITTLVYGRITIMHDVTRIEVA